ncbi:hypothetical protein GGI07_005323 [Coemansia sp. Benny D115]|nr:hypothetical protein GGI07_005323 [Coemansia sp. Benny D115]
MSDFNNYLYGSQQFSNGSMSSMGYPAAMMNPSASADPHQMSMFNQYTRGSFSKPSSAATPGTQVYSSRVLSDQDSFVFCFDSHSGTNVEHNVRQMVASDGSVFIEHVPGYSLVYVPNGCSIDVAAGQAMSGGNSAGGRGNQKSGGRGAQQQPVMREKTVKPSNAFILYRNHKIKELRELMPEINQTEISREAGNLWKTESDEVKELFRMKYREEKHAYDLKKSKRGRSDSVAGFSDDHNIFGDEDAMSQPRKKSKAAGSPNNLGLPGSGSGSSKPRSHTMPAAMFNSSNAKAAIGADFRKQIAARSGSSAGMSVHGYLDDAAAYESPELHQAYAELSASAAIAQHSSASVHSLASSHPSFVNNMSGMQMFSSPGMHPASDHDSAAAMHGYGPASLSHTNSSATQLGPDQSDLASSLVNAGLAAGISMMPNVDEEVGGDLAAAASMAASAAMAAGGFYSTDVSSDNVDNSMVGHWANPASSYSGVNPADTTTASNDSTSNAATSSAIPPTAVSSEVS